MMRTIPRFDPLSLDEPLATYAARVLLFVIANDFCPPVSIDHLELALMRASYQPSMLPATIAAVRQARVVIHDSLRWRYRERDQAAQAAQAAAVPVLVPVPPPDRPNIGPMAPLSPTPIAPPPPPRQAIPDWSF